MTYDKPAYTATRAPSGCYGTVTTEGRVWKLTVFLLYMRTYFVHYHYLVESTSQIMKIRVWPIRSVGGKMRGEGKVNFPHRTLASFVFFN